MSILTRDNIGWNDPPGYDRKLGRMRTHGDDLHDHRMMILDRIRAALQAEKAKPRRLTHQGSSSRPSPAQSA